MNKKGQYQWLFVIFVMLVAIAIMILISSSVMEQVNNGVSNSTAFSTESKNMVNSLTNKWSTIWDGIFLMLFIGSWIAMLVCFYFITEHPVMAIFGVVILIIFLILAPMFANIFIAFVNTPALSGFNYPIMTHIVANYLIYMIAVGISCIGVLYGKGRIT